MEFDHTEVYQWHDNFTLDGLDSDDDMDDMLVETIPKQVPEASSKEQVESLDDEPSTLPETDFLSHDEQFEQTYIVKKSMRGNLLSIKRLQSIQEILLSIKRLQSIQEILLSIKRLLSIHEEKSHQLEIMEEMQEEEDIDFGHAASDCNSDDLEPNSVNNSEVPFVETVDEENDSLPEPWLNSVEMFQGYRDGLANLGNVTLVYVSPPTPQTTAVEKSHQLHVSPITKLYSEGLDSAQIRSAPLDFSSHAVQLALQQEELDQKDASIGQYGIEGGAAATSPPTAGTRRSARLAHRGLGSAFTQAGRRYSHRLATNA